MSREKSQFSRDAYLSRFWLGVPDLCRIWAQSLHATTYDSRIHNIIFDVFSLPICSRVLTHRWPKISSDFIRIYEKIAGGWALPGPRWELTTLPQIRGLDWRPSLASAMSSRLPCPLTRRRCASVSVHHVSFPSEDAWTRRSHPGSPPKCCIGLGLRVDASSDGQETTFKPRRVRVSSSSSS